MLTIFKRFVFFSHCLNRKVEYLEEHLVDRQVQTYVFHSWFQCKAFGARSGCQVSHYVLTGFCFPRTTFTTRETKRETDRYRFYVIRSLSDIIIVLYIIVVHVVHPIM